MMATLLLNLTKPIGKLKHPFYCRNLIYVFNNLVNVFNNVVNVFINPVYIFFNMVYVFNNLANVFNNLVDVFNNLVYVFNNLVNVFINLTMSLLGQYYYLINLGHLIHLCVCRTSMCSWICSIELICIMHTALLYGN
jgi:hypothetical protein